MKKIYLFLLFFFSLQAFANEAADEFYEDGYLEETIQDAFIYIGFGNFMHIQENCNEALELYEEALHLLTNKKPNEKSLLIYTLFSQALAYASLDQQTMFDQILDELDYCMAHSFPIESTNGFTDEKTVEFTEQFFQTCLAQIDNPYYLEQLLDFSVDVMENCFYLAEPSSLDPKTWEFFRGYYSPQHLSFQNAGIFDTIWKFLLQLGHIGRKLAIKLKPYLIKIQRVVSACVTVAEGCEKIENAFGSDHTVTKTIKKHPEILKKMIKN